MHSVHLCILVGVSAQMGTKEAKAVSENVLTEKFQSLRLADSLMLCLHILII